MHKKAEADYQRGMKYKEIAEKYGVSLNTVKSWKQRHGWERKKGAHKAKGVHTKRSGAPQGNKNAVGNKGGAAPRGNSNAVKHGLFQKYLPAESLAIMEQLQESSPLDIVWENIMIQYTAIIRAQQIMYVRDRDDSTTTLKKDGNVSGQKWEVQQAWDKQATFLQAQSRAMGELRSLLKQYEDMCLSGLANEEQLLKLRKLKGEVAVIEKQVDSDSKNSIEIMIKRKGDTL